MRIERLRPTVLRVTLHAYELAALAAAARWVADGAHGELSPDVRERLESVLADYDLALRETAPITGDGSGADGNPG